MPVSNPALPTQQAWITPTLSNGWVDVGLGYNPFGYWRDSFGVIHLRGLIKSGPVGSVICTLPTGYRPANRESLPAIASDGVNYAICRIDVATNGEIYQVGGPNYALALWIDGLTFRAI